MAAACLLNNYIVLALNNPGSPTGHSDSVRKMLRNASECFEMLWSASLSVQHSDPVLVPRVFADSPQQFSTVSSKRFAFGTRQSGRTVRLETAELKERSFGFGIF